MEPKTMFYRIVLVAGQGYKVEIFGEGLERRILSHPTGENSIFSNEVDAENAARSETPRGYYYERDWI